jgi:mutator protein MutT/HAD superfamily hydrolase (TIGR01509 family)
MIEVSAGIIRGADGRILVCRRGEGRRNAHLWEFPGGKRENGEDAAACLRRELMEELSLPVENLRICHTGEAEGIRFTFLSGTTHAAPVAAEHEEVRFSAARDLLPLPFCPADEPVARALALSEPPLTDFFWDYDGTVFDTYPVMTAAFMRACTLQGLSISAAETLSLLKTSLGEAVRTVSTAHALDAERLYRDFRAIEAETPVRDLPPIPGIGELLRTLHEKGRRHYLVTHRDRAALRALEAKGLLTLFTGWVTEEDGFPRKPDPASVLHLLSAHGVRPEQACMIGDRPLDVEAGRRAGLLGCLLDREGLFPDAACDLRVAGAEELTALLRLSAALSA